MIEYFRQYTEKFKNLEIIDSDNALGWYDFPSAILKRESQIKIAKCIEFNNILDAFAGIGYSSLIYSECSNNIYCIEKNRKYFDLLKVNTENKFKYFLGNNLDVFQYFIDNNIQFDFIDLDPFGNCYLQMKYLNSLIVKNKYLIALTAGEIYPIKRNIVHKNSIIQQNYSGLDFTKFKGLGIIHFLPFYFEKIKELITVPFDIYYYFISQQIIRVFLGKGYDYIKDIFKNFPNNIIEVLNFSQLQDSFNNNDKKQLELKI